MALDSVQRGGPFQRESSVGLPVRTKNSVTAIQGLNGFGLDSVFNYDL